VNEPWLGRRGDRCSRGRAPAVPLASKESSLVWKKEVEGQLAVFNTRRREMDRQGTASTQVVELCLSQWLRGAFDLQRTGKEHKRRPAVKSGGRKKERSCSFFYFVFARFSYYYWFCSGVELSTKTKTLAGRLHPYWVSPSPR